MLLAGLLCLTAISAVAQEGPLAPGRESQAEVDRIIRAFSTKETQFRQALNDYAFKRDAVVQTIGMGGQVTGEFHRVSLLTFDDSGNRFEKINFFPAPTLTEMSITEADLEDLGGIQPFALEAAKLSKYNFHYLGKQKIDDLNLYVFDVEPKYLPKYSPTGERFFTGRIWVDDKDLLIVKAKGKGVPEDKNNKFPVFDTYREQIDGRYWFPTYTYADENLEFGSGQVVHMRMRVTYSDYKRARSTVKITDAEGEEMSTQPDNNGAKPATGGTPTPQKPKP